VKSFSLTPKILPPCAGGVTGFLPPGRSVFGAAGPNQNDRCLFTSYPLPRFPFTHSSPRCRLFLPHIFDTHIIPGFPVPRYLFPALCTGYLMTETQPR
jgi:hypothetical protein